MRGKIGLLFGQFGFVHWWVIGIPTALWRRGYIWIQTVGNVFAVKDMAQHLGEPIFQDPTWQGRLIGIFIRIFRLIVGLFAEALFTAFVLILILVWYVLPFAAMYGMVRL